LGLLTLPISLTTSKDLLAYPELKGSGCLGKVLNRKQRPWVGPAGGDMFVVSCEATPQVEWIGTLLAKYCLPIHFGPGPIGPWSGL